MSYILDALKKSEQQRQIQPPETRLPNRLASPSGKHSRYTLGVFGSLSLLLITTGAALAFYLLYSPFAAPPATDTTAPLPAPPDHIATEPVLVIPGLPLPTPVANAAPETLAAQQALVRQKMLAFSDSSSDTLPPPTLTTETAQTALAAAKTATHTTPDATTPVTATPAQPTPDSSAPLNVSPALSTPFLHEIPGLSAQIPELRVSVSIYSNRPANRRARINGTMYYEGDSLTTALILDEIRPRSLVFSFNGQAFQVRPSP